MEAKKKKYYSSIKELEQHKKIKFFSIDNNNLKDFLLIENDEVKIITAFNTAKENEMNYISLI